MPWANFITEVDIQAGWPVDLPPLSVIAFDAVMKSLEKNGEGEIAADLAPAVWPVIARTLDALYSPPLDGVKPHAPSNIKDLLPRYQSWTVSAANIVLGK